MRAFVYQAALLCDTCAAVAMAELAGTPEEGNEDSGHYPQGPYENGGGEADCPQHCDHCNVFLKNPLTGDGVAYVVERLSNNAQGESGVMEEWRDFYADVLPREPDESDDN